MANSTCQCGLVPNSFVTFSTNPVQAHCTCDQTKVNAFDLTIDGDGPSGMESTGTSPHAVTAIVNSAGEESGSGLPGFEVTPTNFVLSGDDIVS